MKKFSVKSFIAGMITCVLAFSCFTVYAEYVTKPFEFLLGNIKVKVDGKEINPVNSEGNPATVFMFENDIYVPVKSVLTGVVDYDIQEKGESVVLSFFNKQSGVKLTDARSIEDYLIENYSLIRTSRGTCRLEFTVLERFLKSFVFDYSISIEMESSFYYDELSEISMTPDKEQEVLKAEIKAHMETLAKDLIKKMPEKKFKGYYDQSYYKNPKTKNIKGFVSVKLCSWINYKNDSIKDTYESVKATDTLVWYTAADTKK